LVGCHNNELYTNTFKTDKVKKGKLSKPDEFIYLNRVVESAVAPYNPYYLEQVPHAGINKQDYYTMSAAGVTHFVEGEAGMFFIYHSLIH
jgi:hypothetical protein